MFYHVNSSLRSFCCGSGCCLCLCSGGAAVDAGPDLLFVMLLQVFSPCFVDCGRHFCSAAAAAAAAAAVSVSVSAASSFLFDYFVVECLSGWVRVVFEWELPPLCFYKFYPVHFQVRCCSFLVWMVRKREKMLTRRMISLFSVSKKYRVFFESFPFSLQFYSLEFSF